MCLNRTLHLRGVASSHHLVAERETEEEAVVGQPVPVLPTQGQLGDRTKTREGGEQNFSSGFPLQGKKKFF